MVRRFLRWSAVRIVPALGILVLSVVVPTAPLSGAVGVSHVPSQPVSTMVPGKHPHAAVARVIIPGYASGAPVVAEGIDPRPYMHGVMGVPVNPNDVGWWKRGAQPGEPGTALFTGHRAVGGAFWHVPDLRIGSRVIVQGRNGVTTRWHVTKIETISKSKLPQLLFVTMGTPRIALVTCGGGFDNRLHHYRDNVITWAEYGPAPKKR